MQTALLRQSKRVFSMGQSTPAEFNAGSDEDAIGLLPILRDLTWPDFEVNLRLTRVCVKHYPKL